MRVFTQRTVWTGSGGNQFLSLPQSARSTGRLAITVAGGNRVLHASSPRQVHVCVGAPHQVLPAAHRRQRRVPEVGGGCSSCFLSPVAMVTCAVPRLSSPQQATPPCSPSAFSVSSTPPDRARFPRGSSARSTFHGAQLRDRRPATYNGPLASPSRAPHGPAAAPAPPQRGASSSLIGKITSKFGRR